MVSGFRNRAIGFEANLGQTDARTRYLSRGDGYTLFLTSDGAVMSLSPTDGSNLGAVVTISLVGGNAEPAIEGLSRTAGVSNYLIGGDRSQWHTNIPTYAQVAYRDVYAGIDMVYHGTGRRLEYDFVVAPGADPNSIRVKLDGTQGLAIDSQGNLVIHTAAGDLTEHAPVLYQQVGATQVPVAGSFALHSDGTVGFSIGAYDTTKPLVIDPVLTYSTFLGQSSSDAGFAPASTANAVTVDSDGNVYITGTTSSAKFPVTDGSLQPLFNPSGRDAFVTKLDAAGLPVFSTYLGGNPDVGNVHVENIGGVETTVGFESADSGGLGIAVDQGGNIYVTGFTSKITLGTIDRTIGFPVVNPFQKEYGGADPSGSSQYGNSSDAFVAKIEPNGSFLVYSSYLGGRFADTGAGIIVDTAGNAYLTGSFGVSEVAPTASVAFLVKVNANGSLAYKKTLGSVYGETRGNAIAAYGNGLLIAGVTNDTEVGTAQFGPLGASDAYVAQYDMAGNVVQVARIGGTLEDSANAIAVGPDREVYITGGTLSTDFPTTTGAYQTRKNYDIHIPTAFVVGFKADLTDLQFATYLGGSNPVSYEDKTSSNPRSFPVPDGDVGTGIAVDPNGAIYVVGETASTDFPVVAPIQSEHATLLPNKSGLMFDQVIGGFDSFITKITTDGRALSFSTYLGGSLNDVANAVATDSLGNIYIVGKTESTDFPTTEGAYQEKYDRPGGRSDILFPTTSAFVVRLSKSPLLVVKTIQANLDEPFNGYVAALITSYPESEASDFEAKIQWGDGTESDGTVKAGFNPGEFLISGEHTYTSVGSFPVVVEVTDSRHHRTTTSSVLAQERSSTVINPSIAIDPNDPRIVYLAGTFPTSDIGSASWVEATSMNKGATWSSNASDPALPVGGRKSRVAADRYGNVFVAYLTDNPKSHAVLLTSSDHGKTFRVVYEGTEPATDVALAVGIGLHGEMSSAWIASEVEGGLFIQGFSVTGLGQVSSIFNQYALVSAVGDSKPTLEDLVIGPKGQVLVTYQKAVEDPNGQSAGSQIFVRLMPGGLDGTDVGPETLVTGSKVGISYTIPAQGTHRISAGPRLAWNQGAGNFSGRLYLVYTDVIAPGTTNPNIFTRISDDNGATWSKPLQMNDDQGTASHFLPSIAIDQSTGDLAVGWYDTRLDPNRESVTYWMTVFGGNGGKSANVRVSPYPSDMSKNLDANTAIYQFGDFSGLAFSKGLANPAWIDNSAGLSETSNRYGSLASATIGIARVIVPPPVVTAVPLRLDEGKAFDGVVATFTYGADASSTSFLATIDWGDGTPPSAGLVTAAGGTPPSYVVRGNHRYDTPGDYIVRVTVLRKKSEDPVTALTNVTRSTGYQGGATIVVDPSDSTRLFAIWQEQTTVKWAWSSDGGVSWTLFNPLENPDGPTPLIGSTAAFDTYGNLFAVLGSTAPGALKFSVGLSTNGGADFRTLTSFLASTPTLPRARLATGLGLGGKDGSVWLTYVSLGKIVTTGASVSGLGVVGGFGPEQIIPTTGITASLRVDDSVVGPDGQLAVTFQDDPTDGSPSHIYVSVDTDGLGKRGFSTPILVGTSKVVGTTFIPAQANQGIDASARLAWDRSDGPNRGRLYLVYTDRADAKGNDTDIFVRYSDDAGATWSAPIRVNQDSAGASQFLPSIAIDPKTGGIAIGWYDTRNDPAGIKSEFFATVSGDGGKTFSREVALGLGPSDPSDPGLGEADMSYQYAKLSSLSYVEGMLFAAWTDNSAELDHNPDRPDFEVAVGRPATAHVAAVPIIVTPLDISDAVDKEGELFTADLATFTQAINTLDASRYKATIDWGDGTDPGTGVIRIDGNHYVVQGSHSYSQFGQYTITVTIKSSTSIAKATLTADPVDAPLNATSVTIHPAAGQEFTGPVATFVDENPASEYGDVVATIGWNDGSVTAGSIVYDGTAALTWSNSLGLLAIGQASVAGGDPGTYLVSLATSGSGRMVPLLRLEGDYRGGLAEGLNFQLYAIRNNDAGESFLDLLNVSAGTTRQVAYLGNGFTGGLAYDSQNGNFYAIARTAGKSALFAIDPKTWATRRIGDLGTATFTGLAYDSGNTFYSIATGSKGSSILDKLEVGVSAKITALFPLGSGFTGGLARTVRFVGVPDPLNLLGRLVAVSAGGDGSAIINAVDLGGAAVLPAYEISPDFNRGYAVVGTHVYSARGTFPINVEVRSTKGGNGADALGAAEVGFEPPIAQAPPPAATAFQGFATGSLTLGSFLVPHGAAKGSGIYSATIDWGDGTTDTGLIAVSGTVITVSSAGHVYKSSGTQSPGAKTGAYHPNVVLSDKTGNSATITTTINVAPDVTERTHVTGLGGPVNPFTGVFTSTGSITNTSGLPITGPLFMVVEGLPAGVSLANADGTLFSGQPFLKVNVAQLGPGQSSGPITLQFKDPALTPFTYHLIVIDGPPGDSGPSNAISVHSAASFVANLGQEDPTVQFISRGNGYAFFLTANGASLDLASPANSTSDGVGNAEIGLAWLGSNPLSTSVGLERNSSSYNYLIGDDPSRWRTDVAAYARVRYHNLYSGIDLEYHGDASKSLEYDFLVSAGADPGQIHLAISGTQSISIDTAGNLVLHTVAGDLIEKAPTIYQESGGVRVAVAGGYEIRPDGTVGFLVGHYDANLPLVIDPVLVYSSYLGGSRSDAGNAIAVDAEGNSYVTGYAYSPDFPTLGGLMDGPGRTGQAGRSGGKVAYVTKLDPLGRVVYSTYIGGSGSLGPFGNIQGEEGLGIAVDAAGEAYVVGSTASSDFPTVNALQPVQGAGDSGFLLKLSATGSDLVFSTYLTGSPVGIALDSAGEIVIAGTGEITPTAGALSSTRSGSYVLKLNQAADQILFATPLPGTELTLAFDTYAATGEVKAVAVDAAGNIVVAGLTQQRHGPVRNAEQPTYGGGSSDAFVAKLNSSGTKLLGWTYLGGAGTDVANGLAVDGNGNILVVGTTLSGDFATTAGAFQRGFGGTGLTSDQADGSHPGGDAFVVKLGGDLASLRYSTYIGGAGPDRGSGIAVDAAGNAYVTGQAGSSDFPTVNPLQPGFGGDPFDGSPDYNPAGLGEGRGDAFALELDATGASLGYSTFLGGSNTDGGKAIAVTPGGAAVVTGYTGSSNFPTTSGVAQPDAGFASQIFFGDSNAFVTRIDAKGRPTVVVSNVSFAPVVGGSFDGVVASFVTNASGSPSDYSAVVNWGDGTSSAGTITRASVDGFVYTVRGKHTYSRVGTFSVSVVVSDAAGNPSAATSSTQARGDGAQVAYRVSVDTSALNGTSGFLDLQLNPGAIPGAQSAGATITLVDQGGGTLGNVSTTLGSASGTLVGTVNLQNSSMENNLRQAFTFGDRLVFEVRLVGDAIATPSRGQFGSTLSIGLLESDGRTPTHGSLTDGAVAEIAIDTSGETRFSGNSASSAVALAAITVADAPIQAVLVPFQTVEGTAFTGTITSFKSGNLNSTVSDFSATIDWNDGTPTESGAILADGNGNYHVVGSHTFLQAGNYALQVVIQSRGGSTAQAASAPKTDQILGLQAPWVSLSGKPLGMASGDFNGDGISDLAVWNRGDSASPSTIGLEVLLGKGDGSFGVPTTILTSTTSSSALPIAVADFNGDGKADIATLGKVLLGHGDGTFTVGAAIPGAHDFDFLTAADFNGDGKVDIVLGDTSFNGGSRILLGNGDGTFRAATSIASFPIEAAGDLNGDGKVDLIGIDGQRVVTLLGHGDGTFAAGATITAGVQPNALTLGDFNGDGILDIAAFDFGGIPGFTPISGAGVNILNGRGDGTFGAPVFSPTRTAASLDGLATGDFNRDGKLDVVILNNQTVSIAFGRGDGSLITASLSTLGHSENYGIATGDFDRDGKNDVAVNDRASGVVVYHGNGDGALQTAALHPVKAGEFLTGDLNGDGVPDLLGQSEVLLGVGDGTFRDGPAAGFVDQIVALADLNGDGKLDLVLRSTANGGIGPVSIMLGQGDGTFRSAHSQPASGNAFDIKLADIDGNGKLDLVVSLHSSFNVLLGNGDGTFQNPINLQLPGTSSSLFAAADLNGDGKADLAVATSAPNLLIYLGRGNGTFQDPTTIAMGNARFLAAGDFNGDGKPDLLAGVSTFGVSGVSMKFLAGNGDGTFKPAATAFTTPDLNFIVADFTGDGVLDVFGASDDTSGLASFIGNGDGTFRAGPIHAPALLTNGTIVSLGAADLNGDGRIDLLAGDSQGINNQYPSISVLMARADGTFAAGRSSGRINALNVQAADLDGDGHPDLLGVATTVEGANFVDKIQVSLNRPGGLQPPVLLDLRPPGLATAPIGIPAAPVVGDFNGDGIPDIAADIKVNVGFGFSVFHAVVLGKGDGTFGAPVFSSGTFVNEEILRAVDVNGDGILDLIALNGFTGDDQLDVSLGKGDGKFRAPTFTPLPNVNLSRTLDGFSHNQAAVGFALGDFNGDGIIDVAVERADLDVDVLLGKGDGTFRDPMRSALGLATKAISAVDMDGDGKLDLVTANENGTVAVLAGLGNGSFTAPRVYLADAVDNNSTSHLDNFLSIADMNGDGIPDVVVGGDYHVAVVLNARGGVSGPNVLDAPLNSTAIDHHTKVGVDFRGIVAHLDDANPFEIAGHFSASVSWGDGQSSPADVVPDPAGGFLVIAQHAYANAGSFTATITVEDIGGSSTSAAAHFVVTADAAETLDASGLSIQAVALVPFTATVATFSSSASSSLAADFLAEIHWGDGSSSIGLVKAASGGGFEVVGTHTYNEASGVPNVLSVSITGARGEKANATGSATVADTVNTRLIPVGVTYRVSRPSPFTGVIATFTDTGAAAKTDAYSASISWGDGTVTRGTVRAVVGEPGHFEVIGEHAYALNGPVAATVVILGPSGSVARVTSNGIVDASALAGVGLALVATEGSPLPAVVGAFIDSDPLEPAVVFTATIDWGDGTSSVGTVAADPNVPGRFQINGSHTYNSAGAFTVATSLKRVGDSGITIKSAMTVTPAAISATFVDPRAVLMVAFTKAVASFTSANPTAVAGDFAATIDWGDGTRSSGAIVVSTTSGWNVVGTHTYDLAGAYTVRVDIQSVHGASAMARGAINLSTPTLQTSTDRIHAVAGTPFDAHIATFDAEAGRAASEFVVEIKWGDGHTSRGSIVADLSQPGHFDVFAGNTYRAGKTYPVTIAIGDRSGTLATLSTTAIVDNAAISLVANDFKAKQGETFTGGVGTFTDANPFVSASDFTASLTINGKTYDAAVVANPNALGTFDVILTFQPKVGGGFPFTVSVGDSSGLKISRDAMATIVIPTDMAVKSLDATAQVPFIATVAIINQGFPADQPANLAATIDWGDGHKSKGLLTVDPTGQGRLLVIGSTTYSVAGDETVTVDVLLRDGSHLIRSGHVHVAPAPPAAISRSAGLPIKGTQSIPLSEVVAVFADRDETLTSRDFTATINWGDGSSSPGKILADPGTLGQFLVLGTHRYDTPGPFVVSTTIRNVKGSTGSIATHALIAAKPTPPTPTPKPTPSPTPNPTSQAPNGNPDHYVMRPNSRLVVPAATGVLANDSARSGIARLVRGPEHGRLRLFSDGSFRYVPRGKFRGNDTFEYVVRSGNLESAPITVTISVGVSGLPLVTRQSTFLVPGSADQTALIRFNWVARHAKYNDEVGVVRVDDSSGRIGSTRPGDPGYLAAALSSGRWQTIFPAGQHVPASRQLSFHGGDQFMLYIVANHSTQTAISWITSKLRSIPVYFMNRFANPDRLSHVRIGQNAGVFRLAWEDQLGGGDRDFNDVVISVQLVR